MKLWLLALIIVAGCSSKTKDKAFQESLDQPPQNTKIEVKAPEKILEKFEVEEVKAKPAPAPSIPAKAKPIVPKKVIAAKPVEAPSTEIIKPVGQLPKDYPANLILVNEKAKKVWDLYKPNHFIDEKMYLDIHYLGMTVGKIMVTNRGKKMIDGKEVWHFHSRFKSAPFYSSIYELDDTIDTYVTTKDFVSIRYSLVQRESKQDVDDLQLHDRDKMQSFWYYKQKKSDGTLRNKQKKNFIPYFSIDPFSMLYFFQGLPMKDGEIYEIPILNKSKIMILKTVIEGREEINTDKRKKVKAIRVHATTQYTGETLKSGDIYLWFSDDNKRNLLKAQAKIKIGSVTADIVE